MPIQVVDPYGVIDDPQLPTLRLALDPTVVKREFKRGLPLLARPDGFVRPKSIRVVRYRPQKRCLIEYDVRVERPGGEREKRTLLGKVRARRFGASDFGLLDALRKAGFGSKSPDGICVPKPVGVLPRFGMWLQRKVPGSTAGDLLASSVGSALARRIAEAAHKLHEVGVPPSKSHSMVDEIRILEQCLQHMAQANPRWHRRLDCILSACRRVAAGVPQLQPCSSHRDFYADQVIVSGPRLYLIDFDLYCWADPGLDIGNFLGHITEQSLRRFGDAAALGHVEQAMEQRFIELAGESVRPAVRAYSLLTLVRHIYLSTRTAERGRWTEPLLELCEERLGIAARSTVYGAG